MEPADAIWLSAVAGLVVADVLLYKAGRSLLTDAARRHKTVTLAVVGLFALHVVDVLGPADPFRAFARFL